MICISCLIFHVTDVKDNNEQRETHFQILWGKKTEVSQQINTDFKDDSEEKQLAQALYNNSW